MKKRKKQDRFTLTVWTNTIDTMRRSLIPPARRGRQAGLTGHHERASMAARILLLSTVLARTVITPTKAGLSPEFLEKVNGEVTRSLGKDGQAEDGVNDLLQGIGADKLDEEEKEADLISDLGDGVRNFGQKARGKMTLKGRALTYESRVRFHSLREGWVYDCKVKDVATGIVVEKRHMKTEKLVVEAAVELLFQELQSKGILDNPQQGNSAEMGDSPPDDTRDHATPPSNDGAEPSLPSERDNAPIVEQEPTHRAVVLCVTTILLASITAGVYMTCLKKSKENEKLQQMLPKKLATCEESQVQPVSEPQSKATSDNGQGPRRRPRHAARSKPASPATDNYARCPVTPDQPATHQAAPIQPTTHPSAPDQPTTHQAAPIQPTTHPSAPNQPTTHQAATIQPTTHPSAPDQPTTHQAATTQPTTRIRIKVMDDRQFQAMLLALSKEVPFGSVMDLGVRLNFSIAVVNRFIQTNVRLVEVTAEGTHSMLRTWYDKTPQKEAGEMLTDALIGAELYRLAEMFLLDDEND